MAEYRHARFVVRKRISRLTRKPYWYFVLEASNGKVIATSEMYTTKEKCLLGVVAVRIAVPVASLYDPDR